MGSVGNQKEGWSLFYSKGYDKDAEHVFGNVNLIVKIKISQFPCIQCEKLYVLSIAKLEDNDFLFLLLWALPSYCRPLGATVRLGSESQLQLLCISKHPERDTMLLSFLVDVTYRSVVFLGTLSCEPH